MDFNSISKSLQDAIVNVTKSSTEEEQHSLEENDIVGVIDGVRSDRKYNDEFHAHHSLGKLVAYQKAKKAELYVNGVKTKHYELNKRYDDFEPKKLSEEQIDELKKSTYASYINKAANDVHNLGYNAGEAWNDAKNKTGDYKKALDPMRKSLYRRHGIQNAARKLATGKHKMTQMESGQMEEATVHPMGLHVKPVKVGGKTKYHVHAVGKELGNGIKVGEHLSDTELDDASEMGAKIKHLKEDQMVDKTIELHDDFVVDLPSELGYRDYLNAAQSYSEDPSEAIMIADSFFKKKDESLVIENFMRSDIESKIKSHEKAGSKVNDTKYSTKNGKPYAEYTVTDGEGRKTRYIHHGSTRRVERE